MNQLDMFDQKPILEVLRPIRLDRKKAQKTKKNKKI